MVVVVEEDDDGVAAGGEEKEEEEEEALAWTVAYTVKSGAVMMGGAEGLEQVRGLRQLGVLPEALTGAFALLAAALCSLCSSATLARAALCSLCSAATLARAALCSSGTGGPLFRRHPGTVFPLLQESFILLSSDDPGIRCY